MIFKPSIASHSQTFDHQNGGAYSHQGSRFAPLTLSPTRGSPQPDGGLFSPSNAADSNTAHLKGKLSSLYETIRGLQEQLSTHKKEVQILRSEKETLESVLTMKQGDTRKALTNELHRVEEEIKRHYLNQRAEGTRLQNQITGLKTEKTGIEKDIVRMQKRIDELELQIGSDEAVEK
jgi:chromosome segregation ATPase